MGFGEYGEMWQDVGRYGERFSQKVSDQFCQSIFSEDNFAFLAYYFEAPTKRNCMRFTNCGYWEIWDNVGEDGKSGGIACQANHMSRFERQ